MRKGIDATKGDFIALIDGDGQMPAEDIIRVYEKIRKRVDLVLTYKKKEETAYTDSFYQMPIIYLQKFYSQESL